MQETLAWLDTDPFLKELKEDKPEPMVWYRLKLGGCVNAGDSENWMYFQITIPFTVL